MVKNNELVSVIIPAYNAEYHIEKSIKSVLDQTHQNWELIIVNDGSEDNTEGVINSFADNRILYHAKVNGGVSSARNVALANMVGDYFCFLDADDELTPLSIETRLKLFKQNDKLSFVDGSVCTFHSKQSKAVSIFTPRFKGNPLKELAMLNESCFYGITWMIKRKEKIKYRFRENYSHAEDILFYIDYCTSSSLYSYTEDRIYIRNISDNSAMSNLKSLENGYKKFYNFIEKQGLLNQNELKKLRRKIKSIVAKSYISNRNFKAALDIAFYRF